MSSEKSKEQKSISEFFCMNEDFDFGCKKEDLGFEKKDLDCEKEDFGCKKEDLGCEKEDFGCKKEDCGGRIIESNMLSKCKSESQIDFPDYKVPVVISEFTVQIDLESKIKLGEPAIEIKRIKKNVFITECRVIWRTHKLFLKGFIRKNIEYATKVSESSTSICGDIKHTTVVIPFQCITEVDFIRMPKIQVNTSSKEITYINEKGTGRDIKETDFFSEEIFNEKIYCELLSARIHEADIIEECENDEFLTAENIFQTIIEKEVLFLSIRLLQKQQVWAKELLKEWKLFSPICDSDEIEWLKDKNGKHKI